MKIWYIMALELAEQLSRLGHKAELLTTRYATLRQENQELRNELLDLQAAVKARDALIQKLEIEIEHLRVSSVIAPDSQSIHQTRALISDLVREIDACVADLIGDV
ncbi:MAG: hypothetical protein K2F63_05820 [Muribaculaceae bacterium]|nr:hypothetical protein [Muribaculaceae bacterium]